MKIKETVNLIGSIFGITLSIFLISFVVFAVGEWTGPSATPPSSNVSAPINTGDETQLKTGALGVGGVLETNTLKITGGEPGEGKVLTTDATGLASWETLSEGETSFSYPPILSWTGDGSDGAFDSTGNITLDGIKQYTTFNLNSGHTITVGSKGYLIILCQNLATIAGTIDATGKGATGSGVAGFGGGAGGSGGGLQTDSSISGGLSYLTPSTFGSSAGGAPSTTNYPYNGYNGASSPMSTGLQALFLSLNYTPIYGAAGSDGYGPRGVHGKGGGSVIILTSSLNFSGNINAKGSNGTISLNVGGGGGGGGFVGIAYKECLLNTGTISVVGGSGGSQAGGYNGGNGGAGISAVIDLSE